MLMFTSQRRSVIALNERTLQGHFFISAEETVHFNSSLQLSSICHFLWFAVEIYVTIERYDRLQVKVC